jgi:starch synthase
LRHRIARWRTWRFDRQLRDELRRDRPAALLAFSDVASEFALPFCKDAGVPTILSMVHGDVREEVEVLERERERSPEFFRIYLGDGPIDMRELRWLHERRLRDLELADRVLVPSEHIAARLRANGIESDCISIIPYAADTERFVPKPRKKHGDSCVFLFAGGITQRKGIKDLLDAWRVVRRSGWTLRLLGGMPRDASPLATYRDEFEWVGRLGHAEMPTKMSEADVFVFPSLFEGSAVVTYEALACGLPSIVTAESGSVARDGLDGVVVPAADPAAIARAMERLGTDPNLREAMSISARSRAEQFGWPRYHDSIVEAVALMSPG